MRAVSYLLIFLGLLSLAFAAYDEYRGVADVQSPGRSMRGHVVTDVQSSGRNMRHHVVARADDPKQFRNLMSYQWFRGPLLIFGGMIILGICRRTDRLDPLSPDFVGSAALDELDQSLSDNDQKK